MDEMNIYDLIIILLPETLNKQLPDTIKEGQNFGK
jgi:hypothetical protein